jgi:hypothetical protein
MGLLLSALLLNKVASWMFVVPFVAIAIVRLIMSSRRIEFRGLCLFTGIVLMPLAATQIAWSIIRAFHHGTTLGIYGVVLRQEGLSRLSLGLLIAYLADFWLAAGLILGVPTIYWLVSNSRSLPYFCAFISALLMVQLGWVGIVEGGLTGILRERLFSCSFPIIALLGARGFDLLRQHSTRLWRVAFLVTPAILSLSVRLPAFSGMAFETPWAYTFGSLGTHGIGEFSRNQLCILSLSMAIGLCSLVWLFRHRIGPYVVPVFVLGFNLCTCMTTAALLGRATAIGVSAVNPVVTWLRDWGVSDDARVLVTTPPAPFERRSIIRDFGATDACEARRLDDVLVWQLETLFTWHVRAACSDSEIRAQAADADYLLTTGDVNGFPFLSAFQHYRLYLIPHPNTGRLPPPSVRHQLALVAGLPLRGVIDMPADGARVRDRLNIGGWVLWGKGVKTVHILIDGNEMAVAQVNIPRPDVEHALPEYHNPAAGWGAAINLAPLKPGKHIATIRISSYTAEVQTLNTLTIFVAK